MLRLAPALRLLQAPLKARVVPKAHVSARPARTPTSPGEQAAGLIVTFLGFLVPAGWVMANLQSYKSSAAP